MAHVLVLIGGLWLLAAMSPGPNFVLVARTAARHRRLGPGLATVAGVALATLVWGLAGALGIRSLFLAAPWAYTGLKLLGGAYLMWIGLKMLRASRNHESALASQSSVAPAPLALFATGLTTNLANPKTAVFMSSLFATTMPPQVSIGWNLAAAVLMSLVSAGWYAVVALGLSRPPAVAFFDRIRTGFDRAVGLVLAGFGAHLIVTTSR